MSKKGFIFGSLLGAGLMWLSVTKKGRELRGQIMESSEIIFEEIKKKAVESGGLEKITKNKYVEMVGEKIDDYAAKNKWADGLKKMVEKVLLAEWGKINKKGKAK